MEREELIKVLQNFGSALAENHIPLTFFVGGDVEFGRTDVMNDTEPGRYLKSLLEKEACKALDISEEYIDELLVTYYLMMHTTVLIEHTDHSVATGQYQPSINRGIFTLCEEEIKLMYKSHGVKEIPSKAYRDLNNAMEGIQSNFAVSKIKALKLNWSKGTTTNPRSLMTYDDGVHIIPTDVLIGYHSKLREMSTKNVYKFTYKRVNTADRVQYVTLNKEVINSVYSEDLAFANDFFEVSTPKPFLYHGIHTFIDTMQGFWSIGDLGLSRFGGNPKRRVSLSRITDISVASDNDVKDIKKYVNVDLDSVLDSFIFYVSQLDEEQLSRVSKDLNSTNPNIIEFVQAQVTVFTTTFLKALHDYMIMNQEIFNGYTGIKKNMHENTYNTSNTEIKFGSTDSIDF